MRTKKEENKKRLQMMIDVERRNPSFENFLQFFLVLLETFPEKFVPVGLFFLFIIKFVFYFLTS